MNDNADDDCDGTNTTVDDRFGLPGPGLGPEPGLGPGLLYNMHASLLTPAFLVYFGMHPTRVCVDTPLISPRCCVGGHAGALACVELAGQWVSGESSMAMRIGDCAGRDT